MLQPKKTKFRRQQKGRMKGNAQRKSVLAFAFLPVMSLQSKWITGQQIEAARVAVTQDICSCAQVGYASSPISLSLVSQQRCVWVVRKTEGFVAPHTWSYALRR